MSQSTEEIEDEVRAILLKAKKRRIRELGEALSDAIARLKGQEAPPPPEPELSPSQRQQLKEQLNEFLRVLRQQTLPPLEMAQAAEAMAKIRAESSRQWQELRPQLDLDLDLEQEYYEQWQAQLQPRNCAEKATMHRTLPALRAGSHRPNDGPAVVERVRPPRACKNSTRASNRRTGVRPTPKVSLATWRFSEE